MIDAKADLTLCNDSGYDPLIFAAEGGFATIVKFLLDCNANIQGIKRNGDTPLHVATKYGHLATTRILLHAGARIDSVNHDGWTPLHLVAREGYLVILQQLLSKVEQTPITRPSNLHDHEHTLHRLEIATYEDISVPTPLQLAAQNGYVDLVQELLHSNLKVEIDDHTTAFTLAVVAGHLNVVKELLNTAFDKSATDPDGNTILHLAAKAGNLDVLTCLLDS